MHKLSQSLKALHTNLLHYTVIFFIFAVTLIPKIPVLDIEFTYINARVDDILVGFVGIVFLFQLLTRKVKLNTTFLGFFIAFWVAVFASLLFGEYVIGSIDQVKLGLLHSLRRVEYMIFFFVALSATTSEKRFMQYFYCYLMALFLSAFYGFGQYHWGFVSFQSTTPALSYGQPIYLNQYDRVNAGFGGYFDFAAYLTFSIPIIVGAYYALKKDIKVTSVSNKLQNLFNKLKAMVQNPVQSGLIYFALYVIAALALNYTAMRSALAAYIVSIIAYMIYERKFKMLVLVLIVTVLTTALSPLMFDRIMRTIQKKTIVENTAQQPNQPNVDPTILNNQDPGKPNAAPVQINVPKLPDFGIKLRLPKILGGSDDSDATGSGALNLSEEEIKQVALDQAKKEFEQQKKRFTKEELEARANEIAPFLRPKEAFLCDESCAIRLQAEWPRAIGAFIYSPIFGTGPSTLTEATDNDFLRWLGEFGMVGTAIFMMILYKIYSTVWKVVRMKDYPKRMLFSGFCFGVIALLVNAVYIDVFEASKVAYNFWFVSGMFVAMAQMVVTKKKAALPNEK